MASADRTVPSAPSSLPLSECRATPSSTCAISCARTCPSSGPERLDPPSHSPGPTKTWMRGAAFPTQRRIGQRVRAVAPGAPASSRFRSATSTPRRPRTPLPCPLQLHPDIGEDPGATIFASTSTTGGAATALLSTTATAHSSAASADRASNSDPQHPDRPHFRPLHGLAEKSWTKLSSRAGRFFRAVVIMKVPTWNRPTNSAEITRLLQAWGGGDPAALEDLAPLVYAELRRMAQRYMRRENPGNTLQPTALVNEAYLRLVDIANVRWQDRAHFFAVAAQMMRRILVDSARARAAGKRGGGAAHVESRRIHRRHARTAATNWSPWTRPSTPWPNSTPAKPASSKCVSSAASPSKRPPKSQDLPETVMRDWKMARAWLMRETGAGLGCSGTVRDRHPAPGPAFQPPYRSPSCYYSVLKKGATP